ncbi:MAG: radical SAM protein, partial [Nanobdellota archaeon]
MVFLRLNITSACNFACKYCHARNYDNKPEIMDFKTLDYSIKSLLDLLKSYNHKEVMFSIYGGEPLLNKKNLFQAIDKFKNYYNGIKINWIVNTNGSLLKSEDMSLLKKYNVDLHISLDGPREINDKSRVSRNGESAFDLANRALQLASEYNLPRQINSYITPVNMNHITELIDIAKSYDIKRIYLDWLYSQEETIESWKIVKIYLKALKYGELKGIFINGPWKNILNNYKNRQIKKFNSKDLPKCIELKSNGNFFFRSFPLSRTMNFDISKVSDIINSNRAQSFIKACQNYFEKKCKNCYLKEYCKGEAIIQYQYHTGDDFNYKSICAFTKQLIPNLLIDDKRVAKQKTVQVNITYDCNRNCSYCYVKDFLNTGKVMKFSDFTNLLNWLEKSNIKCINLTGGEPTTHPDISSIINISKSRGFSVNLFTNLIFNHDLLENVLKADGFLVNLNQKKYYDGKEFLKLKYNLKALKENKKNISIMFCVDKETNSCKHVIDYCKDYGLDYVLIDFTQPNSLKTNQYVSNDALVEVKKKLIKFTKEMALNNILVQLARPIPFCIFTDDEKNYLEYGHNLRGTCSPGESLISINPDLNVYPCLSLFFKSKKITDFRNIDDYMQQYKKSMNNIKWKETIFPECTSCQYFINQICQGGCLCRKTKRFYTVYKNRFTLYSQYPEQKDFLRMLENATEKLSEFFGEQPIFDIFQFDNKKDLYLFSNTYIYPEWVNGFASDGTYYQRGFIENYKRLIHEICHLYIAKNLARQIPNWLNEGICEYLAFGEEVNIKLKELAKTKNPIPFSNMKGTYKCSLLEFDNSHPDKNIAYQQSASLVGFISKKFGFSSILNLLKSKKDFYPAMKEELGISFQ